jgi:hypothetical protein
MRWMPSCVQDSVGSNWCLGKISEPVKLLEHEVATKIWGEMNEGEGLPHQYRGRTEERKAEDDVPGNWAEDNEEGTENSAKPEKTNEEEQQSEHREKITDKVKLPTHGRKNSSRAKASTALQWKPEVSQEKNKSRTSKRAV